MMLRKLPMVPTTTVMMVSTPDIKYLQRSILSEKSSLTPHFEAMVTGRTNKNMKPVSCILSQLTMDDVVSVVVQQVERFFVDSQVELLQIRAVEQIFQGFYK